MKIKRHFVFAIVDIKYSRTYGGCDYTARAYEVKGKGSLAFIGDHTACTRGHKGDYSEAWSAVLSDPKIEKAARRAGLDLHYWDRRNEEKGWKLDLIGKGL